MGVGFLLGGKVTIFFFPILWGSGVKYIVRLEEERERVGGEIFFILEMYWRREKRDGHTLKQTSSVTPSWSRGDACMGQNVVCFHYFW